MDVSRHEMVIKKLRRCNEVLKGRNRRLKLQLEDEKTCESCREFQKEREFLFRKCHSYELLIEEFQNKEVQRVNLLNAAQQEILRLTTLTQLQGNHLEILKNNSQESILPDFNPSFAAAAVIPKLEPRDSSAENSDLDPCAEVGGNDERDDAASAKVGRSEGTGSLVGGGSDGGEEAHGAALTCKWTRRKGPDNAPQTCGKVFRGVRELAAHFKAQHLLESGSRQRFACLWEGCKRNGAPMKTRKCFVIHFRHHSGEKPFRCANEGCAKTFADRKALKTHQRAHDNEKSFSCAYPACAKTFAHKRNMMIHYRVRHEGCTRYKCPVADCDSVSYSASTLRTHMLVHNGEKPYACEFPGCGQAFKWKSTLDRHFAKHAN